MKTYPWMMSLVFTITSKRAMAPGICLELTAWGSMNNNLYPQVGESKVPHSEGEHGFSPPEGYDAFLMLAPGTGYYMEGNYKLKLDRPSITREIDIPNVGIQSFTSKTHGQRGSTSASDFGVLVPVISVLFVPLYRR
ncbi:MAG: hypothetical protein O3C06_08880 [Bacteroidetes bacterium]|nr:hypothetical protein [Bacteroidota bacterium]